MAETPRENAQLRAKEIKRLLARLKSGQPLTQHDVETAVGRAEDAKRRAVEAHLRKAQRHLDGADVHERAATMYESIAGKSDRDVQARLRAMEHSAAAKRQRAAADAEVCNAMTVAKQALS